VVGLACSNDSESYASGSVATGGAFHARQVKGDDRDKNRYPGPPGWSLGREADLTPQKNMFVEQLIKLETGWKQQRRRRMEKDLRKILYKENGREELET